MNKDKMLTMRVEGKELGEIKKLAKDEGHNSVGGFIMWLIRNYKEKKLVRK